MNPYATSGLVVEQHGRKDQMSTVALVLVILAIVLAGLGGFFAGFYQGLSEGEEAHVEIEQRLVNEQRHHLERGQ